MMRRATIFLCMIAVVMRCCTAEMVGMTIGIPQKSGGGNACPNHRHTGGVWELVNPTTLDYSVIGYTCEYYSMSPFQHCGDPSSGIEYNFLFSFNTSKPPGVMSRFNVRTKAVNYVTLSSGMGYATFAWQFMSDKIYALEGVKTGPFLTGYNFVSIGASSGHVQTLNKLNAHQLGATPIPPVAVFAKGAYYTVLSFGPNATQNPEQAPPHLVALEPHSGDLKQSVPLAAYHDPKFGYQYPLMGMQYASHRDWLVGVGITGAMGRGGAHFDFFVFTPGGSLVHQLDILPKGYNDFGSTSWMSSDGHSVYFVMSNLAQDDIVEIDLTGTPSLKSNTVKSAAFPFSVDQV